MGGEVYPLVVETYGFWTPAVSDSCKFRTPARLLVDIVQVSLWNLPSDSNNMVQ